MGLEVEEERKTSSFCRESSCNSSVVCSYSVHADLLSPSRHIMGLRSKFISVCGTTEKSALMTQSKKVALLIEMSDINMLQTQMEDVLFRRK